MTECIEDVSKHNSTVANSYRVAALLNEMHIQKRERKSFFGEKNFWWGKVREMSKWALGSDINCFDEVKLTLIAS